MSLRECDVSRESEPVLLTMEGIMGHELSPENTQLLNLLISKINAEASNLITIVKRKTRDFAALCWKTIEHDRKNHTHTLTAELWVQRWREKRFQSHNHVDQLSDLC